MHPKERIRLHDHSDDNSGGRIASSSVGTPAVGGDTTSTSTGGASVLNDLGDVDLVTAPPADGESLTYDATAGQWVPGTGSSTAELNIEGGQSVIFAHGSMGSTETFDPTDGNVHTGTLNAACTFTLNAPSGTGACTLELRLTQDGTGGWAITWPGSVTVLGTLTTTASTSSIVILETLDGGTSWVAVVVGSGGSSLTVKDEGTPLATAATSLDFVGAGVTASGTGAAKTITIPAATAADVTALGFVGPILIADSPSTPLVFADLLQDDAQTDLMYADL